MNSINYQPTGVYQKLVQNPALLPHPKQAQTPFLNDTNPSKEQKESNKLLKAALIAGAVVIASGLLAFRSYYKKGMDIIRTKESVIPDIKSTEDLKKFLSKKPYGTEEKLKFGQLYTDYYKHKNGITGKTNRILNGIHNFFKENFYNY